MKELSTAYRFRPSGSTRARSGSRPKSLTESVKAAYIAKHHETGYLADYTAIQDSPLTRVVEYDKLPETVIEGYPYAMDYNAQGKLQCHFSAATPNAHELIIGITGCGKSTCLIEPRIRALSHKANKACMFVTDPKGELFRRNASHLEHEGYRVFLVNFIDILHSNGFNPLAEIYNVWMRQASLKTMLKPVRGLERLYDYELQDDPASYGEMFWCYGSKAFSGEAAARRCCEDDVAAVLAETSNLIRQLVHAFIPDSSIGSHDPSWYMGAREILTGLIYVMLEDALDADKTGFTKSHMNLMVLQDYYEQIRTGTITSERMIPLLKTKKLAHKTEQSTSIKILRSFFESAASTSRCYTGVFRNAMQEWFNGKIFTVCNETTIDINTSKGPFAIFLITSDSERSDNVISGLFIDFIYRQLMQQADDNGGRLNCEFHYLLDEFANICAINDFTSKITTARSRNVFFSIVLQSYAQLGEVYKPIAAQTIIDNCNTVFFQSNNYDTKIKFSKECGRHTIPGLESALNPVNSRMVEAPLLTVSRLESLKLGEMYVRKNGMPLLFVSCVPSFRCPEFAETGVTTPAEMGIRSLPFNCERYRYPFLESDLTMREYSFARNVFRRKVSIEPDFSRKECCE